MAAADEGYGDESPAGARPRYLLPAEHPWVNVRRHWTVLLRPGTRGGIVVAVLYVLLLNTSGAGPLPGILLTALAVVLGWFGWQVAEWRHDRFLVTDKRVLLVTGLLTRRVGMMPLMKVTDMTYERSWLGRWLGYGAFVMESAGQDQALHRVDHVPYPDDVAQTMFALLFGPGGGRPGEAPVRAAQPVRDGPGEAAGGGADDQPAEEEGISDPVSLLRLPPDPPPEPPSNVVVLEPKAPEPAQPAPGGNPAGE